MIPEFRSGERSPDLIFFGHRVPDKAKVVGRLHSTKQLRSWPANSGSRTLLPLPTGLYVAKNFRYRTEDAMKLNGVGFSVDLEPMFPTGRTNLRIHPDGGKPGTEGCIGILGSVADCSTELHSLLARGPALVQVLY